MSGRYLQDLAVGWTFGSGRLRISKEQLVLSLPILIRSLSISTKRRAEHNFQGVGGKRLAYGGSHHAAPGRERAQARGRYRWRRVRRIPLATACRAWR